MSDCPAHPDKKCKCGPMLEAKPALPNPPCVYCPTMGMYKRNHVWFCTECWKKVQ